MFGSKKKKKPRNPTISPPSRRERDTATDVSSPRVPAGTHPVREITHPYAAIGSRPKRRVHAVYDESRPVTPRARAFRESREKRRRDGEARRACARPSTAWRPIKNRLRKRVYFQTGRGMTDGFRDRTRPGDLQRRAIHASFGALRRLVSARHRTDRRPDSFGSRGDASTTNAAASLAVVTDSRSRTAPDGRRTGSRVAHTPHPPPRGHRLGVTFVCTRVHRQHYGVRLCNDNNYYFKGVPKSSARCVRGV